MSPPIKNRLPQSFPLLSASKDLRRKIHHVSASREIQIIGTPISGIASSAWVTGRTIPNNSSCQYSSSPAIPPPVATSCTNTASPNPNHIHSHWILLRRNITCPVPIMGGHARVNTTRLAAPVWLFAEQVELFVPPTLEPWPR